MYPLTWCGVLHIFCPPHFIFIYQVFTGHALHCNDLLAISDAFLDQIASVMEKHKLENIRQCCQGLNALALLDGAHDILNGNLICLCGFRCGEKSQPIAAFHGVVDMLKLMGI